MNTLRPFVLLVFLLSLRTAEAQMDTTQILSYEVDPQQQNLRFFWKSEDGHTYLNFRSLRESLKGKGLDLVFAMNGGMYLPDHSPQGLYIENGEQLAPPDTTDEAYGNFYLQPNGIFFLTTEQVPVVCVTEDFPPADSVLYATQSGPMLVIDGELHPKFTKGSSNLHIRNGVGILPNGNVLFAMSKEKINFYDFATYFLQRGCRNALYLDGFVSRAYLPARDWEQLDGNFGVIIGVVKPLTSLR